MWVLVVLLITVSRTGYETRGLTQEFSSKETCEAARAFLMKEDDNTLTVRALCTPK